MPQKGESNINNSRCGRILDNVVGSGLANLDE